MMLWLSIKKQDFHALVFHKEQAIFQSSSFLFSADLIKSIYGLIVMR